VKEEERIAKEEVDKKKAEEAAEKKIKDEEKRLEAEKKAEEERLEEEAKKKAKFFTNIISSFFDFLLHPIESKMDTVLGRTLDPLGLNGAHSPDEININTHKIKEWTSVSLQTVGTSPGCPWSRWHSSFRSEPAAASEGHDVGHLDSYRVFEPLEEPRQLWMK